MPVCRPLPAAPHEPSRASSSLQRSSPPPGSRLGVVGPVGLSVRAVARDLNMASSALYRYVASRDDLLTLLIVQIYDELGAVAEACEAECADADVSTRWLTLCHAVRGWAVAHPHDYALLYGTPVPGMPPQPRRSPPPHGSPRSSCGCWPPSRRTPCRPTARTSGPGGVDRRVDRLRARHHPRACPGPWPPRVVRGFRHLELRALRSPRGAITDYSRYADLAFAQLGADFGLTVATT